MRVGIGRRRVVFVRQVVVFTSLPSHRGGVVRVLGRGCVVCGTGAVMRGGFEVHVEDTCGVEVRRYQGVVRSVRRVLDHELILRVDNPAEVVEELLNHRRGVAGAGTNWREDPAVQELIAFTRKYFEEGYHSVKCLHQGFMSRQIAAFRSVEDQHSWRHGGRGAKDCCGNTYASVSCGVAATARCAFVWASDIAVSWLRS